MFEDYFKKKKYTKLPYEPISEQDIVNLNTKIESYLINVKGRSSLKNGRHIDREKTIPGLGPCRVEYSFQKNETSKILIIVKVEPRLIASEKRDKKYYMISDGASVIEKINCTIDIINPIEIIKYKDMKSYLETENGNNIKEISDSKQANLVVPRITFLYNKTHEKYTEISQFTRTFDYCVKVKNEDNSVDPDEQTINACIRQAFSIYVKRNPKYSHIY